MTIVMCEYDSSHVAQRADSWYELDMAPRALQPGLLATFRLYIVVSAIGPLIGFRLWRLIDPAVSLRQMLASLSAGLVTGCALLVYTSQPRLQQKMGTAFFPLALILKGATPFFEHYVSLFLFVPRGLWEQFGMISLARLCMHAIILTIFIAWQYDLAWPLGVGAGLIALSAAMVLPFVRTGGPSYAAYVSVISTQTVVALGAGLLVGLLMRNQRRQAAELDQRNRKLAHYASTVEQLAITQERNRLARELHDTLAHSLSAVAVQIEAARALSDLDVAAGQNMLDQALETTRAGLAGARRSLHALRASPLEDLGLSLAVRDLAESAAARAGVKLDLNIESHFENLAPEVEQCLYRVAQEALTNVVRHANATSVRVALAQENGLVRLMVSDDGRGFDPAMVGETRYGLRGLRERAEHAGATLLLDSAADKGTCVALEIAAR